MVATFLALLSLAKDKKVSVTGDGEAMEVEIIGDGADFELGEDYFEG